MGNPKISAFERPNLTSHPIPVLYTKVRGDPHPQRPGGLRGIDAIRPGGAEEQPPGTCHGQYPGRCLHVVPLGSDWIPLDSVGNCGDV